MSELNDFPRRVYEFKEDKRKSKATLKASNYTVSKLDCRVGKLEEAKKKVKSKLGAMVEQLISSVEIGYGLEMESFKNKAKKRDMDASFIIF